jgi:hypothetical protein
MIKAIKKLIGILLIFAIVFVGFGGWYAIPALLYQCTGYGHIKSLLIGVPAWGFMVFGMIRYFEENFSDL